MMTNLFSVFDPATSTMCLSWALLPLLPLVMASKPWKGTTPTHTLTNKIMVSLFKEISFTMKSKQKSQTNLILLAFLTIVVMNISALYPQVFSLTSHMTVTLPLSLVFWMSIVTFGWMKNTKHMLIHLVPQGTPAALMMFMVMIELISNLIRPITLCVRLTANLIAGHLLMTLLGNALLTISKASAAMAVLAPLILSTLESAVACIQAYVFMTLITLYITEVK